MSTKPETSSGLSDDAARIVALAKSALGSKYVYGAHRMGAFDCSGLTYWAFGNIGISVPRSAREYARAGRAVAWSAIRPGDVICMDTRADGITSVTHVGIYIGGGDMIHASSRLGRVVVRNCEDYFDGGMKLLAVKRFVD